MLRVVSVAEGMGDDFVGEDALVPSGSQFQQCIATADGFVERLHDRGLYRRNRDDGTKAESARGEGIRRKPAGAFGVVDLAHDTKNCATVLHYGYSGHACVL